MTRSSQFAKARIGFARALIAGLAITPLSTWPAMAANSCPTNLYQSCVQAAQTNSDLIWNNFVNEEPNIVARAVLRNSKVFGMNGKIGACYELYGQ